MKQTFFGHSYRRIGGHWSARTSAFLAMIVPNENGRKFEGRLYIVGQPLPFFRIKNVIARIASGKMEAAIDVLGSEVKKLQKKTSGQKCYAVRNRTCVRNRKS